MRKIVVTLTILAFFSCLGFGIYLSNSASLDTVLSGTMASTPTVMPVPFVPALQNNLLVIRLDDFHMERPGLISLWGVFLTLQDPPSLKVVSLLPADSIARDRLLTAFSLTADRQLAPSFERVLQTELQLAYQYIFLIDDTGTENVTSWLQREGLVSEGISGQDSAVLGGVCGLLARDPDQSGATFDWQLLFPDHAYTNIPFQVAAYHSAHLRSQSGILDCEIINPPSGQ